MLTRARTVVRFIADHVPKLGPYSLRCLNVHVLKFHKVVKEEFKKEKESDKEIGKLLPGTSDARHCACIELRIQYTRIHIK